MDSITDQINQLKAKIQLNASKEAILDYYNESSQQEANVNGRLSSRTGIMIIYQSLRELRIILGLM